MLCLAAQSVEEALSSTRLSSIPEICESGCIEVHHGSTWDHLATLLEHLRERAPHARVRVITSLPEARVRDSLETAKRWPFPENIVISPPPPRKPAPMLAILLTSARADAARSRARWSFTRSRGRLKIVVAGDGSVWRGEFGARIRRVGFRAINRVLRPLRDAEVSLLLGMRLLDEPQNPDGTRNGRRLILRQPDRIEQCRRTGTILKPDLIAETPEPALYEGGYHVTMLPDTRQDLREQLATNQRRRLRNMCRVGIPRASGVAQGRRALDVGCGPGGLVDLLSREGWDALGVDHASDAIALGKRHHPELNLRVASFVDLESWTETFDLITLSHVLEHAHDDVGLLETLRRLMHRDSWLYIEVPWFSAESNRRRPHWYRQRDHVREYTKCGLRDVVERAGLSVTAHLDSLHDEGNEPFQFLGARISEE
jgi:SAM-dependent methyltransferase